MNIVEAFAALRSGSVITCREEDGEEHYYCMIDSPFHSSLIFQVDEQSYRKDPLRTEMSTVRYIRSELIELEWSAITPEECLKRLEKGVTEIESTS